MMENRTKTRYFTRTFTILYEALKDPPRDFPWREVLTQARSMMIEGWDSVVSTRVRGAADTPLSKSMQSEKEKQTMKQFLQLLQDRIGVTENTVFFEQFLYDYVISTADDKFTFDEESVEQIVEFYFIERQRAIDCITQLLRIVNEDNGDEGDEDVDMHGENPMLKEMREACRDTVKWLIDSGLENKAIEWYKDASNIRKHLDSYEKREAAAQQRTAASGGGGGGGGIGSTEGSAVGFKIRQWRQDQLVEQKLREIGAVLDLQFMLYYKEVECSADKFEALLTLFIEHDFGNDFRMMANSVSNSIEISIQRILSISVLILIEALGLDVTHQSSDMTSNVGWTPERIAAISKELLNSQNAPGAYTGALFLTWAAFLYQKSDPRDISNIVAERDILRFVRNGIHLNGLLFMANIFEREPNQRMQHTMSRRKVEREDHIFPFIGHEESTQGYKSVVKGCLGPILNLIDWNSIPSSLLQCIIHVLESVLSPPIATILQDELELDIQDTNVLKQQFFALDRLMTPYRSLMQFCWSNFPTSTYAARFLSIVCFDKESAIYAFKEMASCSSFMIYMDAKVLGAYIDEGFYQNQPIGQLKQPLQHTITRLTLPQGTICRIMDIPGQDTKKLIFGNLDSKQGSPSVNFSGWKVLFNQLLGTITQLDQRDFSGSHSDPRFWMSMMEASHDLLSLVHKVVKYSPLQIIREFDRELDGSRANFSTSSIPLRHFSSESGGGLLDLLGIVLRTFVSCLLPTSFRQQSDMGFSRIGGDVVFERGNPFLTDQALIEIVTQIITATCKCLLVMSKRIPVQAAQLVQSLLSPTDRLGFSQLLNIEKGRGRYHATLALLDTVYILAVIHPAPVYKLYEMLPFICSNIFAVHDTWRYHRLEHRWQISLKCLAIFNRIAQDTSWNVMSEQQLIRYRQFCDKHPEAQIVDTSGGIKLLNAFFRDSSLYQVLFSLIGLGQSFLHRVIHSERTEEAMIVERMIHHALVFLEHLLNFRTSTSQHDDPTKAFMSTPFEDTLLTLMIGKKQVPLIANIFEFTDHRTQQDIRIVACRVVTRIAELTVQYFPRPPSLVSYLGSEASSLVNRCLYRLQSPGEAEEYRTAMLDLIATCVERQRGLAELFLSMSPPTVIGYSSEPSEDASIPKNGCINHVLDIIKNSRKDISAMSGSGLVRSCLHVMESIFQSGEHPRLTRSLRNDVSFWGFLHDICKTYIERRKDKQGEQVGMNTPEKLNLMRSITSIMNILSTDLFNVCIANHYGQRRTTDTASLEKEDSTSKSDLIMPFDKKLDIVNNLLEHTVRFVMDSVSNDSHLMAQLDKESSSIVLLSVYIVERTTAINSNHDMFYDVNHMERWEKYHYDTLEEHKTRNTTVNRIITYARDMNRRLSMIDANLALLRAIHSIVSVCVGIINDNGGITNKNKLTVVLTSMADRVKGIVSGLRRLLPGMVATLGIGLNVSTAHSITARQMSSIIGDEPTVMLPLHPWIDRLVLSPLHHEVSSLMLSAFKGIQLVQNMPHLSMYHHQGAKNHTITGIGGRHSPARQLSPSISTATTTGTRSSTMTISSALENVQAHQMRLAYVLNIQMERKKPSVCRELLSCVLLLLSEKDERTIMDSRMFNGVMINMIQQFKSDAMDSTMSSVYSECCRLAMSILALCVENYFTENDANFICRLMDDAEQLLSSRKEKQQITDKASTESAQPKPSLEGATQTAARQFMQLPSRSLGHSSSSTSLSTTDRTPDDGYTFTYAVLNLLLALSNTGNGFNIIVANSVVQQLANLSNVSVINHNPSVYVEGERAPWHNIWCLSLKLICTLLNHFIKELLVRKTVDVPEDWKMSDANGTNGVDLDEVEVDDIDSEPIVQQQQRQKTISSPHLRVSTRRDQRKPDRYPQSEAAISEHFLNQCFEFCSVFSQRITTVLTNTWQQRPVTLASVQEAELVSMLIHGLAAATSKFGVLGDDAPVQRLSQELPAVVDAVREGFIRCADSIQFSHLVSKVQPMTTREKRMHDKDIGLFIEQQQHMNLKIGIDIAAPQPKVPAVGGPQLLSPGRRGSIRPSFFYETSTISDDLSSIVESEENPTLETLGTRGGLEKGRDEGEWSTQIDTAVYSATQLLLATLRILTEVPTSRDEPNSQVMISLHPNSQSYLAIKNFLDSSLEMLKTLTKMHDRFGELIKDPSLLGFTPSELQHVQLVHHRNKYATQLLGISHKIICSMHEALFVISSHLVILLSNPLAHVDSFDGPLLPPLMQQQQDRLLLQEQSLQQSGAEGNSFMPTSRMFYLSQTGSALSPYRIAYEVVSDMRNLLDRLDAGLQDLKEHELLLTQQRHKPPIYSLVDINREVRKRLGEYLTAQQNAAMEARLQQQQRQQQQQQQQQMQVHQTPLSPHHYNMTLGHRQHESQHGSPYSSYPSPPFK